MDFSLTKEQKQVLVVIFDWLKKSNKPYITLGGYAGTGKTTLMGQLRQILNKVNPKMKVAFCAYTGKASRVLQATLQWQKAAYAQDSVSTIHSLIYAPLTDTGGRISGWKKKEEVVADLIVVDEASMVDGKIWKDLLSFGIPILAVGDHGQLPPIEGTFNLMEKPELTLETIHRQAEDNPIIQLSMMAREEGQIPIGNYGNGVRKLNKFDSSSGQEVEEILRGFSNSLLVLAGYNKSRMLLNRQIRSYRDLDSKDPKSGDRVICLKNNWEKGIYNGMVGKLQRLIPVQNGGGRVDWYDAEIDFEDDGLLYAGKISAHQFGEPKTLHEFEGLNGKALGDLFDFGYALTVHKAQGSQAEKVLLFEERFPKMNELDWRRWLYTGITRAEEYLTIVGE